MLPELILCKWHGYKLIEGDGFGENVDEKDEEVEDGGELLAINEFKLQFIEK